jgi:zinc transport system substrate-binding protein
MPFTRARTAALALAVTLVATGCGGGAEDAATGPSDAERITIVTDTYPTAFAAQQVVGDRADVVLLTSPGVEPHDLELTPKQVAQVADADLVAFVPGMIPAVDQAAAQEAADRSVDVTADITRLPAQAHDDQVEHADESSAEHADGDPHVWMDPGNMAAMGRTIAAALTARGLGTQWDTAGLDAAMAALDEEFRAGLAACTVKPLVVSHAAFGYLADAYGFEQHGIAGLSPDAEPSPNKLAELSALVRDEGVTTVYFESLASPDAAQAIAAETGVRTAMLDPIEGNTDDQGYEAIMRANLAAIEQGQGCR